MVESMSQLRELALRYKLAFRDFLVSLICYQNRLNLSWIIGPSQSGNDACCISRISHLIPDLLFLLMSRGKQSTVVDMVGRVFNKPTVTEVTNIVIFQFLTNKDCVVEFMAKTAEALPSVLSRAPIKGN